MQTFGDLLHTKVSCEGQLWVITIDRPNAQNALDLAAHHELDRVFDAFVADAEASVAILTGAGSTFCNGHDYAALQNGGDTSLPRNGFAGLTRRFENPKPIIAAVNGDALDEGFELALACDLVVANEDARFAMQQALWGRAPTEGGVQRLVRQVPLKKAMAALLTGTPISASEGVLLGFVNDITAFDQVMVIARQWAQNVLRLSRQSVRAIKYAATHGQADTPLAAALGMENPELDALLASPEYAGSVARIVAEREPT